MVSGLAVAAGSDVCGCATVCGTVGWASGRAFNRVTTIALLLLACCTAAASSATLASVWESSRKSESPSQPVFSISSRIDRTASTSVSRAPVTRSLNSIVPSRSCPRRCSPLWVIAPSFAKPKNPLVPLIVWTVRKMLASRLGSRGFSSSATKSWSSWSRFSADSTRNSRTNSSFSLIVLGQMLRARKGTGQG